MFPRHKKNIYLKLLLLDNESVGTYTLCEYLRLRIDEELTSVDTAKMHEQSNIPRTQILQSPDMYFTTSTDRVISESATK